MKTFLNLFLLIIAFLIFVGDANAQILRKNRKCQDCTQTTSSQYTRQSSTIRNIQPSYSNLQACHPYTSFVPCGQPGCLNQGCPGLNCPTSCCNPSNQGFQGIQTFRYMPATSNCPTCIDGSCKLQKK